MVKKYIEQQDLLLLLNSDLLGYACAINLEDDSGSETAKAKYEELKRVIDLIENQKSIEVKCPKDIEPIFVDKNCIVNIVRCANCYYYEDVDYYPNGKKSVCRLFKRQMQPDDYCSYGEKK